MRVVRSCDELGRALRSARSTQDARSVGFVPTMGAMHAGHRSLVERAASAHDEVVVSIFVNPLQFDRSEDLEHYPRDLEADLGVCEAAGATLVFAPSAEEMYPRPPVTTVSVAAVSAQWEGASRPGHFEGVTTVLAKLFYLVGPSAAYFGEKDFEQLVVVRRMVADLSAPVEIVSCPTGREPDGLALSSRNARLSEPERAAATALFRALAAGRAAVSLGEQRPDLVAGAMAAVVATEPLARLDYAAAVDAYDLAVPETLAGVAEVRLLVAAEIGQVRLIDNCTARLPASSPASLAGSTRGGNNQAAGTPGPAR